MTCDQAIELLPWLLNGTLEAGERDEVRRHLASCERCRQALTETRETWTLFDQHVPSRDLVALAWGERPAGIDPALAQAHLASCPQCAAELELARMSRRLEEEDNVAVFPAPRPVRTWRAAAVAAGLAFVVASSGWFYTARQASDLARTAQARPPAPVTAPVPHPQTPAGGEDSGLREQVARLEGEMQRLMGLQRENEKKAADAQAQVARLERERATLARPQGADIVMFEDVVRGESGAGTTVRAGAYSSLLLQAQGATGQGSAEILDESGKVVFQVPGLVPTEGFYSVVLPPGALRPGRYTVRIKGQDEGKSFQVVP